MQPAHARERGVGPTRGGRRDASLARWLSANPRRSKPLPRAARFKRDAPAACSGVPACAPPGPWGLCAPPAPRRRPRGAPLSTTGRPATIARKGPSMTRFRFRRWVLFPLVLLSLVPNRALHGQDTEAWRQLSLGDFVQQIRELPPPVSEEVSRAISLQSAERLMEAVGAARRGTSLICSVSTPSRDPCSRRSKTRRREPAWCPPPAKSVTSIS